MYYIPDSICLLINYTIIILLLKLYKEIVYNGRETTREYSFIVCDKLRRKREQTFCKTLLIILYLRKKYAKYI